MHKLIMELIINSSIDYEIHERNKSINKLINTRKKLIHGCRPDEKNAVN